MDSYYNYVAKLSMTTLDILKTSGQAEQRGRRDNGLQKLATNYTYITCFPS